MDAIHFPKKFRDEVVEPKLKNHFRRDEFLGRINEIIYFVPFSRRELLQLVNKDLTFWQDRARQRHEVELEWDTGLVEAIADGYNIHYGARSIRHEVERSVINPLAAAYERLLLQRNSCVKLTAETLVDSRDALGRCTRDPRAIKILVGEKNRGGELKDYTDITETLKESATASLL